MASQLRRSGRAGHDLLVAGEGQHGTGGVRHVRSIVCRVPRIADAFAAAPGSGPYRRQGRRRVPAAMASRTLTCSARPWDIRARATAFDLLELDGQDLVLRAMGRPPRHLAEPFAEDAARYPLFRTPDLPRWYDRVSSRLPNGLKRRCRQARDRPYRSGLGDTTAKLPRG